MGVLNEKRCKREGVVGGIREAKLLCIRRFPYLKLKFLTTV